MIRNIDIKLNAAHPQLPILEATTFVGSPSAVMIHGVPPSVGAWRINAVRVVATYPDNTAHTVAAVLGAAGTWVATIPATDTSGRVAQGLQIIADGTDERGESVTGYVLGIAGLAVYTRDMTIESAAGVKYYIHLLDDEPAEPKEGDAYLNGSTLVIYHDGEWTGIGGGSVELDNTVTRTSGNGVKSSGIWSAIWGALTAVPGFSSLYDWCVAQLAGKASTADATLTPVYSDTPTFSEWVCVPAEYAEDPNYVKWEDGAWQCYNGIVKVGEGTVTDFNATIVSCNLFTATRTRTDILGYQLGSQSDKPLASVDPLLFAQYYPEGNVKSAAEFTQGLKYDTPDTTNRTITVKPFCDTGTATNDNSSLVGRVVIPPFVDGDGNGYISDDGTRYKVVGVSDGSYIGPNDNLITIIAPNTVTTIGNAAFSDCTSLASASLPAATNLVSAFGYCSSLASVSLPAATSIGDFAFSDCTSLASVDFGDTPRPSVPTLGEYAFLDVPTSCKIIVPDAQYDAWIAASGWSDLYAAGYKFLKHSEWEYARKYDVDSKAPLASPAFTGTPTAPTPASGDDSTKVATTAFVKTAIGGITPGPDNTKLDATSAAPAFSTSSTYAVDEHCTYNGKLYRCTTAVTVAGEWNAANWTADTMTDPDAVLDITSQNQLRIVAKDGTLLWAQGYDLASTSSATLACDAVNNFTFADGATSQAFALPTAPTGKVGDFILDIDNSANTGAATMTLTGLDTTFSVVVPKGESLTDMLSIAAGELARFYITLTTFRINNLPTWQIVKQVVENGGAQS